MCISIVVFCTECFIRCKKTSGQVQRAGSICALPLWKPFVSSTVIVCQIVFFTACWRIASPNDEKIEKMQKIKPIEEKILDGLFEFTGFADQTRFFVLPNAQSRPAVCKFPKGIESARSPLRADKAQRSATHPPRLNKRKEQKSCSKQRNIRKNRVSATKPNAFVMNTRYVLLAPNGA